MNIVIVEDEPVIAQRIQRQVVEILVEWQPKLIWFDNFDDAQSHLSEKPIDLLLLDLNLHGSDGFELLKTISAEAFHTIIISAYSEQAIKAFEFGVLDFVAKPFNLKRLTQALARFTDKDSHVTASHTKQLAVKKPTGIHLIEIRNLSYVKADGHYTELHLVDETSHLHDKPIDKLAKLLPDNFVRIHRSYITNILHIKSLKISSGGSYQVILTNNGELPVSRGRYSELKSLIAI